MTINYELNDKDLRECAERKYGIKIPKTAKVSYTVPGGGDWSHMDAPVDKKNPVTVTIKGGG